MTQLADLNAFLSRDMATIKGWCVPQLWQSLWPLRQAIGDGPIGEIGVYEGKFFTGLCKTFGVGSNHAGIAIDVFDMQEFNLDSAGVGRADVFLDNLDRFGIDEDRIEVIQADSLSLGARHANAIVRLNGELSFFSVDGCHEVVHTLSDIRFAMSVTANHGVIAVDDFTNPNWPGVQEAIARLYLMDSAPFVPLLVTCNKLLLCSASYAQRYRETVVEYLRANHPTTRIKETRHYGFDTLVVVPELQDWTDLV